MSKITKVCGFKDKAGLFWDTQQEALDSNRKLNLRKAKEDFGNIFIKKVSKKEYLKKMGYSYRLYDYHVKEELRREDLATFVLQGLEKSPDEFLLALKTIVSNLDPKEEKNKTLLEKFINYFS